MDLIKDIVFELSDNKFTKFLIAICDNILKRKIYSDDILNSLCKIGLKCEYITLNKDLINISEYIKSELVTKRINAIIIDGIENLNEDKSNSFLLNLNFKRDFISKLSVSILIWVNQFFLNKIVSKAPDFWSRRTSTYYFNKFNLENLIQDIFEQNIDSFYEELKESKITLALKSILINEQKLRTINLKNISPLYIDKYIKEITIGVEQLKSYAKMGKSLQITLVLWNLTRIDEKVQGIIYIQRKLSAMVLNKYFSSIYDIQTDSIIELSNKIIHILNTYKTNIIKHIWEEQTINLLDFFYTHTNYTIRKMLREMEKIRDNEISLPSHILDQFIIDKNSFINTYIDYKVNELINYLEKKTERLPKIFSKEEGKLMRLIYNAKYRSQKIARELKIPMKKAKEKIIELKAKVYEYLNI